MIPLEKRPDNQRARLSVEDFLLLADAGAFDAFTRTELIEGDIWVVNAVHRRHARIHASMVTALGVALATAADGLVLYSNPATRIADDSLPEPDIAVGEGEDGPIVTLPHLRIAIEIADSTLAMDLGRKAHLYARARVPEYWVVDCDGGVVHQMWSPAGDDFVERRRFATGERITAATVPGLAFDLPSLS